MGARDPKLVDTFTNSIRSSTEIIKYSDRIIWVVEPRQQVRQTSSIRPDFNPLGHISEYNRDPFLS